MNAEYQKEWQVRNKEKCREYRKRWLEKNKDKHLSDRRKYWSENRERCREIQRKSYAKNRDKRLAEMRQYYKDHPRDSVANYRRLKYGLTEEQYEKMLAATGGRCPICKRKFSEKRKPAVDHCHNHGIVRGIKCNQCNTAEGLLGSPEATLALYQDMLKNELFYRNNQN